MSVLNRLVHAWNAFTDHDDNSGYSSYSPTGISSSIRQDRSRYRLGGDKSILSTISTRIAIDCAAINIRHVRVDENDRYVETIRGGLNECLSLAANVDQEARFFFQDLVQSMLEEGTVGVAPIETSISPLETGGYEILTMRVGKIIEWFPRHVRMEIYDDRAGIRKQITLPKDIVAIVENPLYTIMNEHNSTLQRLIRKLSLLDSVDEQVSSGKLDIIIQLPYVIKSEARRQQANQRRTDIEDQLKGSKYGIAYTDGTERITQLNRPAENNMLKQVEYLYAQLYSQLGLTPGIFDGSANEAAMLNYYNRTIEPILTSITQAMTRKFLTKTARTQGQTIQFFRDPFKLVPVAEMAEIADKFARNEILTANEIRGVLGFRPSEDPKADKLLNSNMPQPPALPEKKLDEPPLVFEEVLDRLEKSKTKKAISSRKE